MKVQLWDTAGQEQFRSIVNVLYRGAHGVVIVFDLSSRESFEGLTSWVREVEKHVPKEIPRILVGNKCDMVVEREITTEEGKELADKLGMEYIETSARDSVNVQEVFESLARKSLVRTRAMMNLN